MKKYLSAFLLILVIISCTTKKEENSVEPAAPDKSYISNPVGSNNNGDYKIFDNDSLEYKWGWDAKLKLGLSSNDVLSDFSIVKIETEGSVKEDCYLLLARIHEKSASIASILFLKDDTFYFEPYQNGKGKGCQVIICKGVCEESPCYPTVIVNEKDKILLCSDCNSCNKLTNVIF